MTSLLLSMMLVLTDPYATEDPVKPLVQAAFQCSAPAHVDDQPNHHQAIYKANAGLVAEELAYIDTKFELDNISGTVALLLQDKQRAASIGEQVIEQAKQAARKSKRKYSPNLVNQLCWALLHQAYNMIELELAYAEQRLALLRGVEPSKPPSKPLQGSGNYEAIIDESGRVQSCISVSESYAPELAKQNIKHHRANCRLIKKYRYQVATLNGLPIPYSVRIGTDQNEKSPEAFAAGL